MTRRPFVPLLLVLQWGVMVLLAWPAGDFPINDDWAYVPAVRTFLDTGQVTVPPWAGMNFLAHLIWGALFGSVLGVDFFTMRMAGLAAGLIGVLATYGLCRELGGSRRWSGLSAAVVAANPIYFGVSASFMTDAPFMAAAVASLWMYARALRTGSLPFEVAGTVLAAIAILVRQTGLALPLAFALGLLWRDGPRAGPVLRALVACTVGAGSHLIWKLWLQVHDQVPPMYGLQAEQLRQTLQLAPVEALAHAGANLGAIGLYGALSCAIPLLLAVWQGPRSGRWAPWCRVAAVVLLGLALYMVLRQTGVRMPLLGNQLTLDGLGPRLGLARATGWMLWSGWSLLTLVSALAVAAATVLMLQRLLHREMHTRLSTATVLLLSFIGVSVAPIALLNILFDRYVIVLLPPLLALLAAGQAAPEPNGLKRPGLRARQGMVAIVLVLCSLFCAALAHDFFVLSREKWRVLNQWVERGVPPSHIDGGIEFNGMTKFSARELKPGDDGWWVQDGRIKVRNDARPGHALVEQHVVHTWLPFTPSALYVMVKK